jgi:hypothetical protein
VCRNVADFTHEYKRGKWNVELLQLLAATAEKGRSFRRENGFGEGVFELPGGHCQKNDFFYAGDERFFSMKGNGSLPANNELAAAVPVAVALASSTSSSPPPLGRSPNATTPLVRFHRTKKARGRGFAETGILDCRCTPHVLLVDPGAVWCVFHSLLVLLRRGDFVRQVKLVLSP